MPAQLWIVKMGHPGVLLKLIREPESILKEREHMEYTYKIVPFSNVNETLLLSAE